MPTAINKHIEQEFVLVTRTMSLAHTPTLSWVLPMYEHMKKALVRTIGDATLASIRSAAHAGLIKLSEYHVKALACQYNRISTSELYIVSLSGY